MTAATCCSSFSRFCLICVNVISLVIGMLVLGIGIWMAITPEGLYEAMDNNNVPFIPSILKPEVMNTDLVLGVLLLGSITFLTGTVGFWGAVLHSRCMLKTFAILMLLFITAEVVPSVMMWIKLRGEREKTMLLERVEGRCASMHRNVSSLPIALCHLTFVAFECCGFNNYTDFVFAKGEKWNVPWSCCTMRDKLRLVPDDEFCPGSHDEDSINIQVPGGPQGGYGGPQGGYQPQGGYPGTGGPQGGYNPQGYGGGAAPPLETGHGPYPSVGPGGGISPQVAQWFYAVDKDRSGSITLVELKAALINAQGQNFSDTACKLMIGMFDKDRSGHINLEEFDKLYTYINQWLAIFKTYDRDQSGHIDDQELIQALSQMGFRFSPEFISSIVKKCDPETKQRVTVDQFIVTCVQIQRFTEEFRIRDKQQQGIITIGFEDFLSVALSVSV